MNHWKTRAVAAAILGAIALTLAAFGAPRDATGATVAGIVAAVLLVGAVTMWLIGERQGSRD